MPLLAGDEFTFASRETHLQTALKGLCRYITAGRIMYEKMNETEESSGDDAAGLCILCAG
jgi:hypothetical protein